MKEPERETPKVPQQQSLNFQRSFDPPEVVKPRTNWVIENGNIVRTTKKSSNHNMVLADIDIPAKGEQPRPVNVNIFEAYHLLWDLLNEHNSNPLSSLISSKTMLLPHQVQAALHVVESFRPRILIADEVGLGKTVETGLIIKELILKYNFEKVLVVVPAPLIYQWEAELASKFNEHFTVITGPVLRRKPDILQTSPKVIVSVDLLREAPKWDLFLEQNFDIVVFDEAHRLRRDMTRATRAYQFAEKISQKCKALLLLSATPFRGKLEEIYYLIYLIDPDLLGPLHTFMNNYAESSGGELQRKLSSVVIRRRKIDVGGFTRRFARTIKLKLPPEERVFYDSVTEYVRKEYNRAVESSKNVRAFVMVIFQKLLDSSSYALLKALEKRRERLEQMYHRALSTGATELEIFDDAEVMEEFEDEFGGDDEIFPIFDPTEVRKEILTLNRLIMLGKKIEVDTKLKNLHKTLHDLRKEGHTKVIIFTQFKKTMEYISEYLNSDFQVTVFHGGLSGREKEKMIAEFFDKTDVLICTEAGGEGRNLQVATALINYDLPWSPLKVEQRIGRIHRFGQHSDVYIINFATSETIAEKVLEILERKIRIFEDAFGPSDVLLGTSEDDSSFEKSIRSFLAEKKSAQEVEEEVEKSCTLAKNNLKKIDSLISTEVLNYDMSAFMQALDQKRSQGNFEERLHQIFALGTKKEQPVLKLSRKTDNRILTYTYEDSIRQGTFYSEVLDEHEGIDYLSIGHPYIDQHLQSISDEVEQARTYRISSKEKGVIVYFQAHIHLDRVYNRYYRFFYKKRTGKTTEEIPTVLLDEEAEILYPGSEEIAEMIAPVIGSLEEAIEKEIEKLQKKVQFGVDFWKNNVKKSHHNIERELKEKLEIQQGKAKWYGEEKMTSAITRTENRQKEEKSRATVRVREFERSLKARTEIMVRHICELT